MPANGIYSMTFEVYDADVGGSQLAVVGPLSVNVTDGIYEAELPLSAVPFDGTPRYLQITVTGELLEPRIKIVSVPYAYFAGRAEAADAADIAAAVEDGAIVAASVAPGAIDTAALADEAVTAIKIGIICSVGDVLVYDGLSWVCSSLSICPQGSFISCYGGPPDTLNVGVCQAGISTCNAQGTGFGPCTGEVLPSSEICNGVDDDCDGLSDEDGACATCTNGVQDGDETDVDCGGSCPGCADGQTCGIDSDCASNFCDPNTFTCAPQPCTTSAECQSGFCVDGFCCNGACGESCDACDVAGSEGSCTVVADGSAGDPSCTPYLCDGANPACASSCVTSADCASGHFCDAANQCVPL